MAFVNFTFTIEDGRGETSTLRLPVSILAGGLAAIPAIGAYIAKNVARLVQGGLKSARACVELDVSILWGSYNPADDTMGALPQVNEKALFSFRTVTDTNGRTYPFSFTLPAVDDSVVFVDGTDTIDVSNADVQAFIDMITQPVTDLSDGEFGGQVSDSFQIVDSRFLEIGPFVGGDRTWGNRRK